MAEERLRKIRGMIWQDLAKPAGLASMEGSYIRVSEARAYWRHSSSTAKERIISVLQMRQVMEAEAAGLVTALKRLACDKRST